MTEVTRGSDKSAEAVAKPADNAVAKAAAESFDDRQSVLDAITNVGAQTPRQAGFPGIELVNNGQVCAS